MHLSILRTRDSLGSHSSLFPSRHEKLGKKRAAAANQQERERERRRDSDHEKIADAADGLERGSERAFISGLRASSLLSRAFLMRRHSNRVLTASLPRLRALSLSFQPEPPLFHDCRRSLSPAAGLASRATCVVSREAGDNANDKQILGERMRKTRRQILLSLHHHSPCTPDCLSLSMLAPLV